MSNNVTTPLDIQLVEGRTAQETAYLTLRKAAMIGTFQAGQPITIRGVAKTLDMSATPIREAFRRLSAERAFTVLENRRIMIPQLSKERFEELIELRVALETHAAIRALPYINDKKIEELINFDQATNDALARKDHAVAVISNQRFHSTLYQTNPEQIIMPMIESVWLQIGPILKAAAAGANLPEQDYHLNIIDAVRQRDIAGVSKAIEQDIRESLQFN